MSRARPFLRTACLLAALASAPLAGAEEMYRWLDDEGRIHLGETPPPGARAIERVDGAGSRAVINVAPDSAQPPADRPSRRPAEPEQSERSARAGTRHGDAEHEPTSIGGKSEAQWRRAALQIEERIEQQHQRLEKAEDDLSNAYALGSAAYYQRRVESAKAAVADAERELERLEDRARELGVPPGWLRE